MENFNQDRGFLSRDRSITGLVKRSRCDDEIGDDRVRKHRRQATQSVCSSDGSESNSDFFFCEDDEDKQVDYASYMLHHLLDHLRKIC